MAVGSEVVRSLGAYLKAQVQNAVIVTGLYMLAFAITGVTWWPVSGFVAGVFNLIPHLGPLLALGLPLFLKWTETNDWAPLAYIAGAWFAIQVIDGFLLSPRAAGRAGVNPLVSILVTLGAGLVFGPLGMLLAVPLLAVAGIVLKASRVTSQPPPRA